MVSSSFLFENVVPRMTHRILFISEAQQFDGACGSIQLTCHVECMASFDEKVITSLVYHISLSRTFLEPRGPTASAWLQLRTYSGKTPEMISTWIKLRSSKLEHYLVDITPTPVFSRLKRPDNWVVSRVEVFGGMLVLGRITAANMPTFETEAQVYPRISDSQTILTPIRTGCDLSYLVKMCTLCSQDRFLSDFSRYVLVNGWLLTLDKQEGTEGTTHS